MFPELSSFNPMLYIARNDVYTSMNMDDIASEDRTSEFHSATKPLRCRWLQRKNWDSELSGLDCKIVKRALIFLVIPITALLLSSRDRTRRSVS